MRRSSCIKDLMELWVTLGLISKKEGKKKYETIERWMEWNSEVFPSDEGEVRSIIVGAVLVSWYLYVNFTNDDGTLL